LPTKYKYAVSSVINMSREELVYLLSAYKENTLVTGYQVLQSGKYSGLVISTIGIEVPCNVNP
jgi:hypothetical protein